MNSDCKKIAELLAERAVGHALTAAEQAAIDTHLAACSGCAAHAKQLIAAANALNDAPDAQPSIHFNAVLAEKINRARADQHRPALVTVLLALRQVRRLGWGAAIYAIMLVALGIALFTKYHPATTQPVAQTLPKPGSPEIYFGEDLGIPAPTPETKARVLDRPDPYESVANLIGSDDIEMQASLPPTVQPNISDLRHLPEPPLRGNLPTRIHMQSLARARFETIKTSWPSFRLAVSAGVLWLTRNQQPDGRWAGQGDYTDVETTAAVTLALMEAGFAPSDTGDIALSLRSGLQWLVRQRHADGTFTSGPRRLQAQAMACITLCEALRVSENELAKRNYRPVVQQCVTALMAAQNAKGSWGSDDPELTSLCLISAGSARGAYLLVPAQPYNTGLAWLNDWKTAASSTAYATVTPGSPASDSKSITYATIAQALAGPILDNTTQRAEAAAELLKQPVVWESGDYLRWYTATLAAYRLDGDAWQKWRWTLLHELLDHQQGIDGTGPKEEIGSWAPHNHTAAAGRAYTTALALLSITGSCGHSPAYGSFK